MGSKMTCSSDQQCCFCGSAYSKLAKAHIIPKSLYGDLITDTKDPMYLVSNNKRPKRSLIGVYDENILCKTCDSMIGKLDQFLVESIRNFNVQEPLSKFKDEYGTTIAEVHTINNSRKLMVAIISVIWRTHISKIETFSTINLGNEYGDLAKNIIAQSLSMPQQDFSDNSDSSDRSLIFEAIIEKYYNANDIVMFPQKLIKSIGAQNLTFYTFSLMKHRIHLKVSNQKLKNETLKAISLNTIKDKNIYIIVDYFNNSPVARNFIKMVKNNEYLIDHFRK
ncbi:hypothetical protein [Cysteiniphilum halobium]|uniref:hypothetical protein n=1 Tax=Cysteiniphilum halobium TaxID=2219059 RepID=UPI0013C36D55|nr:hypothetical protein [Cysteiniphilum halobium]